jgi:hypothetical protein
MNFLLKNFKTMDKKPYTVPDPATPGALLLAVDVIVIVCIEGLDAKKYPGFEPGNRFTATFPITTDMPTAESQLEEKAKAFVAATYPNY